MDMANQKEPIPHAGRQGERLMSRSEGLERELPEAVRTLLEARTGDAVYVVGPDYAIVHWDQRMENLSGVLSEEALGKPCYEAVVGEVEGGRPFCAHGCSVMHLAQEGRPVSSYEMRIRTRSGRRWVSATNLTVETEDGPYLVHLLRDAQGTHDTLEMAKGLIQLSTKQDAPAPRRKDALALTPRQLEVLKLLSEGKNAREIGGELYLSQATVRNHIRALSQAFGAHSQLEVLAKAREAGVL
jgi:DNA-binding CsgD family transcriptional regulator